MYYVVAVNVAGEPWEWGRARTRAGAVSKLKALAAMRRRMRKERGEKPRTIEAACIFDAEGAKNALDYARCAYLPIRVRYMLAQGEL